MAPTCFAQYDAPPPILHFYLVSPLSPSAALAVVLTKDGREVGRIREQAYFGEKALIDDAPRDASATGESSDQNCSSGGWRWYNVSFFPGSRRSGTVW